MLTDPEPNRFAPSLRANLDSESALNAPTFRVAPAYRLGSVYWHLDPVTRLQRERLCIQPLHPTAHDVSNTLNTSQWKFYVASRTTVEERTTRQMGLATLARIAGDRSPMAS